jgi:excisionase family DNA binding protein
MKNPKNRERAGRWEEVEPPEEGKIERWDVSTPLLTVAEAGKYLGVGRKMVYGLIERGEIAAVRAGGSTLVEKKTLDQFRERGTLT